MFTMFIGFRMYEIVAGGHLRLWRKNLMVIKKILEKSGCDLKGREGSESGTVKGRMNRSRCQRGNHTNEK